MEYRFIATFLDGKQIVQEMDDRSRLFAGKNSFYEVLEYEKRCGLMCFVLQGEEHTFGVDLRDGHFEVDGVPFWMHRVDRERVENFRLIYFRNVARHFNTDREEIGVDVGYTIGWQATVEGRNEQRILKI